jgi:hypothetical protein
VRAVPSSRQTLPSPEVPFASGRASRALSLKRKLAVRKILGSAGRQLTVHLHKFESLECSHVCWGKVKPFAIFPLQIKAIVPIGFYACRVVCANDTNGFQFIRKLYSKFVLPPAGCVASTQLLEPAGLHQINLADLCGNKVR